MANVTSDEQRRFEKLYADHKPSVLAYCRRRVRAADAFDACSETFLVAWRRIDDVPAPPKTLPYLYGIAARVISNQRRSLYRRSRLHAKLVGLGVEPPVDPNIVILQTARAQEVVAAVRGLKPKDQEIVMLYAWEDLPRDTIAEMMGMTKAAVDQRIHRSYQRLGRILAPGFERHPIDSPPIATEGGT